MRGSRSGVTPEASERLRRRATAASVSVAATLTVAKLAAWLVTGSVAILSSLLDSLVDVVASLVILFSVRHALRPPDRAHRFGHGKAEPLGAMAQAAFIAGSAVLLIFESAGRFVAPQPVTDVPLGIAVMALSIVLTVGLVLYQRHVVRLTGSPAIDADRLHFSGDTLTGLAVLAALVIGDRGGLVWLDPVTAVAIALYLLVNSWRIGRAAADHLMDRELPKADRDRIAALVEREPGVRGLHDLRTRSSGVTRFIELHLELDGRLTLREAHDIADRVEALLTASFPDAEVLLHQEPAGLDDERLDRRIAAPGD